MFNQGLGNHIIVWHIFADKRTSKSHKTYTCCTETKKKACSLHYRERLFSEATCAERLAKRQEATSAPGDASTNTFPVALQLHRASRNLAEKQPLPGEITVDQNNCADSVKYH